VLGPFWEMGEPATIFTWILFWKLQFNGVVCWQSR
jgi:hypothetical protein